MRIGALDGLRPSVRQGVVSVVVAILIALPLFGAAGSSAPPMDEGILLSFPSFLLRGARPGIDFNHPYGPGNLWILAGAFRVFGASLFTERVVGLLYRLVIVAATWALLARHGRRLGALAAVLVAWILAGVGLGAYAWFGAIGLALVGLASLSATTRATPELPRAHRRAVLSGVCFGFALVVRPDLIFAVALTALVVLITQPRSVRLAWLGGAALHRARLARRSAALHGS